MAILAPGSRGDVRPHVALARGLIAHGRAATLIADPVFAPLAAQSGVRFAGAAFDTRRTLEKEQDSPARTPPRQSGPAPDRDTGHRRPAVLGGSRPSPRGRASAHPKRALTVARLTAGLSRLAKDKTLVARAEALARSVRQENGLDLASAGWPDAHKSAQKRLIAPS